MTDTTTSIDSYNDLQETDYVAYKPKAEVEEASRPSTAKGTVPTTSRNAIRYHYTPGSRRSGVTVQIDTGIIIRQAKADELNRSLQDDE